MAPAATAPHKSPLSPGWRRIALTAHVTASVGWFGAVAAFLVLAVVGMGSQDAPRIRAAYIASELITWFAIVPLAIGSVITGVIQSVGTVWGLIRHWWVLVKIVMTVPATLLLLLHTRPIGMLADMAAEGSLSADHAGQMQVELLAQTIGALAVLLVATGLSIFKPPGRTSFGRW